MVEQRSPKPRAEGSSPSAPAKYGAVVQLVRTPACHAGGRGFKSLPSRHLLSFEKLASYLLALLKERNASVAQLVEQRTENPRVVGSIPTLGTVQV